MSSNMPGGASSNPGFERAATDYDSYAVLQRKIGEEMIDRLQVVNIDPRLVVDVGCGTGFCTRELDRLWRSSRTLGIDLAAAMVKQAKGHNRWLRKQSYLQADAVSLPLPGASVDLVFSNLMLQWCDPMASFAEFRRVLNDGGLLMFSTFGPDTLRELRTAWAMIDDRPHVIEFADMHDHGDALLHSGFREPVMDVDHFTLTYSDVLGLLRDLHGIGSRNINPARSAGLMGRGVLARLERAYQQFADNEQRLPASYEVVYGHAWSGGRVADGPGTGSPGRQQVPVDLLRRAR